MRLGVRRTAILILRVPLLILAAFVLALVTLAALVGGIPDPFAITLWTALREKPR